MRTLANNSTSQYILIFYLSVALLLGQAFKLHMHVQHDGLPSSTSAGHVVDMHVTSSPRDITYDTRNQSGIQDLRHPIDIEIKVSPDSIAKKIELLKLFVALFLIAGIILFTPRLRYILSYSRIKTRLASRYYLLYSPLRAPPGTIPV